MAKNELEIRLIARDEVTKSLKKIEKQTKASTNKMQKNFVDLAAKVYIYQKAIMAVGRTAKVLIDNASKVEQLQIRLEALTGSAEEGNKVFEDMAELAGRVPKTYDEIMESATQLAGVVRGGAEEVKSLMPVIVDLSAATGISVQDVTSQMIRMYSAGAASADMFRERGVLAMLGFQAGVSYSAEETMRRVIEAWSSADSKFGGASQKLADTWEGKVSMMNDAWFKFTSELGKKITESDAVDAMLELTTNILNVLAESLEKEENKKSELQEQVELLNTQNDLFSLQNEAIGLAEGKHQGITEMLDIENQLLGDINEQIESLPEEEKSIFNIDPTQIEDVKAAQQEIFDQEKNNISVLDFMRNNLSKQIQKYQKTEFKNDQDKAKAKLALDQQILDTSLSNMETMLKAEAENSKAAAIAFKGIQLGRAIINTSEAVTEAMPNIPLAALAAAVGAAEIATIVGQSFAVGTPNVPQDMTANIHQGETIIPATFADAIRSGELTLSGAGGGAATIIVNVSAGSINSDNINALGEELGFAIDQELRNSRGI